MANNDDLIKQFVKERNEAVYTFDVATFKAFYRRWVKRGFYSDNMLPSDNIIEISLRKMVLGIANAPEEKREEARAWLKARGYRESF